MRGHFNTFLRSSSSTVQFIFAHLLDNKHFDIGYPISGIKSKALVDAKSIHTCQFVSRASLMVEE